MLVVNIIFYLKWNHLWYKFVKIHIDSLGKPWVHCPQSHVAITKKPAAQTKSIMNEVTDTWEQKRQSVQHIIHKALCMDIPHI